MKKALLFITLLITTLAEAKEILPQKCKPLVIKGDLITIPQEKSRLIALHNLTQTDLWITHPVTDARMSAGLSSRLQSGKWSLLKMNRSTFVLSCIESKPGHEQQITCQHVVSACEWPTISKRRQKEIFWVAENMALPPLIAYATRQGWMLPPYEIK